MADNTLLNAATVPGGDTLRTVDKTGTGIAKTAVNIFDVGGGTAGDPEVPVKVGVQGMPVAQEGTWTIDTIDTITNPVNAAQSGTWTIDSITNPVNAAQSGLWNINQVQSIIDPVPAAQSGLWNVNQIQTIVDPVPATQSGLWNVNQVQTIVDPVQTKATVQTSGGATPGKHISTAGTNAVLIKNTPGTLYHLSVDGIRSAPAWIKLYDSNVLPVVGTDTPVWVKLIPARTDGAGREVPLPEQGIEFTSGIAMAITAGIADSDTAPIGADEVAVSYGFA